MSRKSTSDSGVFLRNFMFGIEDSLVSTVGLLSGVAAAGMSKHDIFVTGLVLIWVEAFSMAMGSYLSEDFAEDFTEKKRKKGFLALISGVVMFFSYFVAGFVPLIPYILLEVADAFWVSIGASILALFLVGAFISYLYKASVVKHGTKMALLGGVAILVGYAVGKIF